MPKLAPTSQLSTISEGVGHAGTGEERSEGHKHRNLGPVVQSIVSLTSSLRGQLVKCFMTL